jgi:hypothetical protein
MQRCPQPSTRILVVANKRRKCYAFHMDEGRKRVIGIIAGILMSRNLDRADDLFGGPQGSPRTDKMIAAAIQWAELNHEKDRQCFPYQVNYPRVQARLLLHSLRNFALFVRGTAR